MKKTLLLLCLAGILFIAMAAQNQVGATTTTGGDQGGTTYHVPLIVHQQPVSTTGQHSILGKPTISAAYINRELAAHGSPAVGTGTALYDLGMEYGIDPAWPLAFFWNESNFGTTGEATVTRSLGNERCIADRPCTSNHFAVFTSWVDGYQHWYRLLFYGYIRGQVTIPMVGHPCSTIEQIIPIYVGDSSSPQYISDVLTSVARYRAESEAR